MTAKMGRITVKHYLNINLKPYKIDGEDYYKIYFLLRYNNKNTKIKSLINEEMTLMDYEKRKSDSKDILHQRIENEIKLIEKIIGIADKTNQPFEIKLFNDIWQLSTYPILGEFNNYIQWISNRQGNFGNELNFYEQLNVEAYCEVLNSFKSFIYNSKHSISDELFLMQFFDKEIIDDYRKNLRKKDASKRLFKRNTNVTDKIIKTEYEPYEADNIQIIKDCIWGYEYKNPFFYHCPKIEKTGNFEIDKEYYAMLFNLISTE
jgi:hypothetical protein